MFKHILVPVDGSATSFKAVDKAVDLAKAFDGKVTVIYVIDPYPFTGVGTDFAYGQATYLSAASAEANDSIRAARERIEAAGVSLESTVVENHTPWRGIIETANAIEADLIVMGSHGRRGLEKMVLGSVAQRVLQHADQPVLVVRAPE
ncbi:MAG: universal stress protein [Burkholderiaceae bacterium]|jgi:nucleotide-binding universal stress UspA family protein|nr:universal stress protein [Burkholderiaceae bacterium]